MPPRVQTGQLIRREPSRVVVDAVTPQFVEQFATECGMRGTLRLVVCNEATGVTEKFNVDEPFAIVGRASNCQVRLNHPDVNYRHAYLQVIQGHLYCYDLDSEHGIRWGSQLRKKGPLTAQDVLNIGPFSIRLSQAAAYGPAVNSSDPDWDLENTPLDETALRFMNASGRKSHSPLRPLRAAVTLLGRSGRCHHKLSDTSVSQVHCSVVRTEDGFWVVDLLGRDGTSVNGRSVRFAKLEDGDELTLGRFRMQLCETVADQDSVLSRGPIVTTTTNHASAETDHTMEAIDDCDVIPVPPPPGVPSTHNQANFHGPVVGKVHGISENVVLAMMEQFGQMQQQLLAHTQQQMTMLAQMFSGLYQGQQASIVEQLNRIHEITSELHQLRAGTMTWPRIDARETATTSSPTADDMPQRPAAEPPAQVDSKSPAVTPAAATVTESPLDDVSSMPAQEPSPPPDSTGPIVDVEPDSAMPFNEPAEAPRAARSSEGRDSSKVVDHEWVTQRISDLERERNGRWRRLLQLIGGGKDLN